MMKTILQPILFGLCLGNLVAQVGDFGPAVDVGHPKVKGSSAYDEDTQTYTLKGGGYNIWFNHDEFHFLPRKIKGDFLLTANFQLLGNEQGNGHRKTGWMIRESTDHDAVSVNTCVHGDGLAVLQWRLMRGAYMRDPQEETFFPKQYLGEVVIQLERIGKSVTMRLAHPGEPLADMGSVTLPELKDDVLIGPYVLAHDPDGIQEARVWNIRIATPVPPDWHPNRLVKTASQDGLVLGTRLETVEVATGMRKVLHESAGRIASPAFSKDGHKILFEQDGQTSSVPVAGGAPQPSSAALSANGPNSGGNYRYYRDDRTGTGQIWRGKADGSETRQLTFDLDHAWFPQLSPDGRWLAYLAYPQDANPQKPSAYQRVVLRVLPVDGGAPRSVAYLFGGKGSLENPCWSPDGARIVFLSSSEKQPGSK